MIKSNEHNWLKPPAQTRIPYYANSVTLTPDFPNTDGIVASGTPYPANDETIQGFIVNDVDLSVDTNATICISGIVNIKQLPVELTEDAKASLLEANKIKLMSDGWFENVTQPIPPEPNKDIVFQFTGASFQIPISGRKNNVNAPYDWVVYADDQELGVYAGTGYDSGAGISITGLENATHTVAIKPNGEYSVGWGCAFGFYNNTSGANAAANKDKLTAVLNDPDWAHLYTETNTGNYFRAYQCYGCTNLTQIPDEDLPDTVITVGNYYRYIQCYNCKSLTKAATEISLDSVTSIGNYFRYGQYQNCTNLRIGSYIYSKQFATLLNQNQYNYLQMFYLSSTATTPDTMPQYYLADGSTAPVTNLTPSADKNYVTNRTGITGYDNLNANWK
jgi:hypothetical protein